MKNPIRIGPINSISETTQIAHGTFSPLRNQEQNNPIQTLNHQKERSQDTSKTLINPNNGKLQKSDQEKSTDEHSFELYIKQNQQVLQE